MALIAEYLEAAHATMGALSQATGGTHQDGEPLALGQHGPARGVTAWLVQR